MQVGSQSSGIRQAHLALPVLVALLGYAYQRLGMYRDAQKQLASSLKMQPTITACMLLAKVRPNSVDHVVVSSQEESSLPLQPNVGPFLPMRQVYIRLDQPQNAIRCYQDGLKIFSEEAVLLAGVARIHEAVGDLNTAVAEYKKLLRQDRCTNEAKGGREGWR